MEDKVDVNGLEMPRRSS